MNGRDLQKTEKQLRKLAKLIRSHGFRTMINDKKLYTEVVYTLDNDPTLRYKWEKMDNDLEFVTSWIKDNV